MHQLSIDELQPGMLLGQEIVNDQGRPLLAGGAVLTAGFIRSLKDRGCQAAWIMDGMADDIQPPEIISPRLRTVTKRHLQELLAVAQTVKSEGEDSEATMEALSASAKHQMVEIRKDVQQIVEEAANTLVISGITGLKNSEGYDFDRALEVASAAVLFGHRLHIDPYDLEGLALGCLLLDLGNLTVPREILKKPGKLSAEELAIVRRHTESGYEIARRLVGDSAITARHVVRQHHERQDGTGYPQGLRGSNSVDPRARRGFGQGLIIPAAEIAAVADVYAALTSDRPHRPSLTAQQIVATIRQMAGTHLNKELVARFLSIMPAFPVMSQVVVRSGKLIGYRGVVSLIDPRDINHPTVRILADPNGRDVRPFEVNTSKEKGIEIALASHAILATASA